MNVVIFGSGYVGLSLAVLFSQKHNVTSIDIVKEKIDLINNKKSPISDSLIEDFLTSKNLNLTATLHFQNPVSEADYVVVATPTNFDEKTNEFNTSSVTKVINDVRRVNLSVPIIIKSTIPVGFCDELRKKGYRNIYFSPEFLREGRALFDNLYPSRIIVGGKSEKAKEFGFLLKELSLNPGVPLLFTSSNEAEAIKLFSNTYLAMRVAFFNELDSFALSNGLNTEEIIKGVTLDPRIGEYYCNPSFGYGGYCLPKDSKQLLHTYNDIPQNLITAIVESNKTRKKFLAQYIIEKGIKRVGLYRLVMKKGSDNFRASALLDIMSFLQEHQIELLIFEPLLEIEAFSGVKIEKDFNKFASFSDLILTNRQDDRLKELNYKVFSRDIFGDS